MSEARIWSVRSVRTTGRLRASWLIALALGLVSCHAKPLLAPAPTHYVINPDVPEDDFVCVVVPNAPPYDPALAGVHCMTVHDLRVWFGRQQAAQF